MTQKKVYKAILTVGDQRIFVDLQGETPEQYQESLGRYLRAYYREGKPVDSCEFFELSGCKEINVAPLNNEYRKEVEQEEKKLYNMLKEKYEPKVRAKTTPKKKTGK